MCDNFSKKLILKVLMCDFNCLSFYRPDEIAAHEAAVAHSIKLFKTPEPLHLETYKWHRRTLLSA